MHKCFYCGGECRKVPVMHDIYYWECDVCGEKSGYTMEEPTPTEPIQPVKLEGRRKDKEWCD